MTGHGSGFVHSQCSSSSQEVAIALCNVVLTYLPEVQSAGIEIMNEKERREREAAAARYSPPSLLPPTPRLAGAFALHGIGCKRRFSWLLGIGHFVPFTRMALAANHIDWFQTAVSLFTVVLGMGATFSFQRGCRFLL
jgi:hypothetical protein